METVTDFIFLGSKFTADGDCSHEIKRCLLLGRKAMTNLDGILKTEPLLGQQKSIYAFSSSHIWTWELDYKESWAQWIDAFELWCGKRLLRVPWAARRSNQSILKEISPKYSLEGLMLKLKFQYFGHLMGRSDSFEKTLMLGKIEGRRGRDDRGWDGWMASPTWQTRVWESSGSWWWTGRPGVLRFMGSQRVGHDWVTRLNWTDWGESEQFRKEKKQQQL